MFTITEAKSGRHIRDAATLFREYEAWLELDLCFQGFEEELRSLPGRYSAPDGRLLLAYDGDAAVGCTGMRRFDQTACEMKRLYVSVGSRGHGLGKTLVECVIAAARFGGYQKMLLDTYPPKMGKAVTLYESHGFRPIPPYYENPYDGVFFMELTL